MTTSMMTGDPWPYLGIPSTGTGAGTYTSPGTYLRDYIDKTKATEEVRVTEKWKMILLDAVKLHGYARIDALATPKVVESLAVFKVKLPPPPPEPTFEEKLAKLNPWAES